MFKKFKAYVEEHGAAKTAFLLGYKDTPAIRNWLHRGEIPSNKKTAVKSLFTTKIKIEKEA